MSADDIIKDRECAVRTAAYEIVNLRSRLKMITFFKDDGTSYSASYAHLYGVEAIADGLRLDFGRVLVVVKGERLEKLHRGLTDYRVTFLRESSEVGGSDPQDMRIRKIIVIKGQAKASVEPNSKQTGRHSRG